MNGLMNKLKEELKQDINELEKDLNSLREAFKKDVSGSN